MIEAYPLQYPAGWQRSTSWKISKFGNYTFEQMRTEVLRELKLLGARDVIISSNLKLRQDGYPYSSQAQPEDRGIAVYFTLDGEQQCIPCDRWHRVEDNLRAIVKTVEALRGIERWGAKDMVSAAFRGFKALPTSFEMPASSRPKRAWFDVLGVKETANAIEVKSAYRNGLKLLHPGMGGNSADFQEFKAAYEEWLAL